MIRVLNESDMNEVITLFKEVAVKDPYYTMLAGPIGVSALVDTWVGTITAIVKNGECLGLFENDTLKEYILGFSTERFQSEFPQEFKECMYEADNLKWILTHEKKPTYFIMGYSTTNVTKSAKDLFSLLFDVLRRDVIIVTDVICEDCNSNNKIINLYPILKEMGFVLTRKRLMNIATKEL